MIATRSPGSTPRPMRPLARAPTSSAKVCTVTGTNWVPSDALRSKITPAGSRARRSLRIRGRDMYDSRRPTPGVLACGRLVFIVPPPRWDACSALGGRLVELGDRKGAGHGGGVEGGGGQAGARRGRAPRQPG